METNFYMTRINPAGKLQCCPDALGSCDYNEVLGTDGRGRGPSTGFVTIQIPSLPDMPRSSVSGGEKGLWRQPHTLSGLLQTGACGCPCPERGWHWHAGSGRWPGSEGGEQAQHCLCGLVLPMWMTATSSPASLLPLFNLTTSSPHRGQSELLKTEIR